MSVQLPPRAVPTGLTVVDEGHALRISWRWVRLWAVMLMILIITLLLFCVLLVAADDGDWIAVVICAVLCLAVAPWIVSRTEVVASPGRLQVRTRPFPAYGGTSSTADPHDVKQLFVRGTPGHNGEPPRVYNIYAEMETRSQPVLLAGNLPMREFALHLEPELERYLEIENRTVGYVDEIPRRFGARPRRSGPQDTVTR